MLQVLLSKRHKATKDNGAFVDKNRAFAEKIGQEGSFALSLQRIIII
jgi:hypothetical protein